jgi:hypothetical protein
LPLDWRRPILLERLVRPPDMHWYVKRSNSCEMPRPVRSWHETVHAGMYEAESAAIVPEPIMVTRPWRCQQQQPLPILAEATKRKDARHRHQRCADRRCLAGLVTNYLGTMETRARTDPDSLHIIGRLSERPSSGRNAKNNERHICGRARAGERLRLLNFHSHPICQRQLFPGSLR